jgi:hypothetical protein
MYRFEEYLNELEDRRDKLAMHEPEQAEPWRPFRTRLDFELAALLEDTNMNRKQKAAIIKLFKRGIAEPSEFTIIDENDLAKTWDGARNAHLSRVRHRLYQFVY